MGVTTPLTPPETTILRFWYRPEGSRTLGTRVPQPLNVSCKIEHAHIISGCRLREDTLPYPSGRKKTLRRTRVTRALGTRLETSTRRSHGCCDVSVFQRVPFSPSILPHLTGVSKFIHCGDRFQKVPFSVTETPF